jgi:hypothetical protein
MFSDRAKLIALAIVHIFETSKPFGDYSAVAVLDDGAGVSYGINQFTHKSGSLYMVLNTYLGMGGSVGADEFELRLPTLKQTSKSAIVALKRPHLQESIKSRRQDRRDADRTAAGDGECVSSPGRRRMRKARTSNRLCRWP